MKTGNDKDRREKGLTKNAKRETTRYETSGMKISHLAPCRLDSSLTSGKNGLSEIVRYFTVK